MAPSNSKATPWQAHSSWYVAIPALLVAPFLLSGPHWEDPDQQVTPRGDPEYSAMLVEDVARSIDLSDAGRRPPVALALTPGKGKLVAVRDVRSSTDLTYAVSVATLVDNSVSTAISNEEGRPLAVAVSEQEAFVAVSQQVGTTGTDGDNRVDIFDISGAAPVFERSIPFPESTSPFGPAGIALHPGGQRAYVADRGNFRVYVIDTAATENPVIANVKVPGAPSGIAVSHDGTRVYVANRTPSTVLCMDTATNEVGGASCAGRGEIGIAIGPSSVACQIILHPDGSRAYVACPGADPCISVLDTEPLSETFNQEIAVLPATTDRLETLDISSSGRTLFAVSRFRREILLVDTESGRQTQRVTLSQESDPVSVAFAGFERLEEGSGTPGDAFGVAYVADRLGRRMAILDPGRGAFLPPEGDSTLSEGLIDTRSENPDCPDPYNADQPDPGLDETLAARRDPDNFNCFFYTVSAQTWRICVAPDDPYSFVVYPPGGGAPANSSPSLWERLKRSLPGPLQLANADRHLVSISELDPALRPRAFVVDSVLTDGQVATTTARVLDDGDGLANRIQAEGSLLPRIDLEAALFDVDGNGRDDFVSWPISLSQLRLFLPLTDTNGDGAPDSTAFDFDRDGVPDAEFPPFPFVAGPANPSVELRQHFAQFGNGRTGDINLFSEIQLLNRDRERPAQVRIVLRDDNGQPLKVSLNGQNVNGELTFAIPPSGLRTFRTSGEGEVVAGSVTVLSDRAVGGVVLFGGGAGLAGVGESLPRQGGFAAFVEGDEATGLNTGVAVVNLEETAGALQLLLTDLDRNPVATAALGLEGNGHLALFIDQIPWQTLPGLELNPREFQGLIEASYAGRMAATVLQTRPRELAALPVFANVPPERSNSGVALAGAAQTNGLDQELHFAQFADGSISDVNVASQMLLVNLSRRQTQVRVAIRGDDGNLLAVDLDGEATSGELDFTLAPGASRILGTDGAGPLTGGSVAIQSDGGLGGALIFAGTAGVAGVARSVPFRTGFRSPVERREAQGLNTGVALVALKDVPVTFQLTLRNLDGEVLARARLDLPPGGHRALFVDQIDWQPEPGVVLDLSEFSGLIVAETSDRAAATAIQTRPGVFATLPVVTNLN